MSRWLQLLGLLVAILACVAPLLLSELVGGWTKKYTSPNTFSTADIPDLTGKVAIVTGANTGIGYESALEMARKGASVIVCARSSSKGKDAVDRIHAEIESSPMKGKAIYMNLDLGSFRSIEKFAAEFSSLKLPIDILMLNAGVMKSPGAIFLGRSFAYGYEETEDGFESHIGVNHIGHQYLTSLLQKSLAAPSRIVSVSSKAEIGAYNGAFRYDLWRTQTDDYEDGQAYGQSKLANIMFARELAQRLEGKNITVTSCHPGAIKTELGRYLKVQMDEDARRIGGELMVIFMDWMATFVESTALFDQAGGALTQLQLATSPQEFVNGGFYTPIGNLVKPSHPDGMNMKKQKELWRQTEIAITTVIEKRRNSN